MIIHLGALLDMTPVETMALSLFDLTTALASRAALAAPRTPDAVPDDQLLAMFKRVGKTTRD